ncbi:MAG: PhzF family phenazine biosynthesis protein [Marmoricola sp.]
MAMGESVTVRLFQLDAFATRVFAGNPAAVVVLDHQVEDAVLAAIAAENNLPETAFISGSGGEYAVRWFTPTVEVPLCGHATLASAAVVLERLEPERDAVTFESKSGLLLVRREADSYVMNFPARIPKPVGVIPHALTASLGTQPVEVAHDGFNYIARLASAQAVRSVRPQMDLIADLPVGGVIVTAVGDRDADIVSRYFAPAKGIPEDPVTGGAHCSLAPFWADRMDATEFNAHQASARGGDLTCSLIGDRVELKGSVVFFLEGRATLPV